MTAEVWSRPTTFTVCAVPEDVRDWLVFAITVEETGPGTWAVRRGKRCLNRDGGWEWESIPSEREDAFLARTRFGLDEALDRARTAALAVTHNGWTVAQAAADWVREDAT